ncbi:MAG TPA: amino acid ABC transporter permease [Thermoplasmata archaeon]
MALLAALLGAHAFGAIPDRIWQLLVRAITEGSANTFRFSITIIPIGAALGFFLGWARVSRHPILAWPSTVYVDLVRGMPQIVMILFAFFLLPSLLSPRNAFESGIFFATLALAIHTSAYQAEIFRAGFQSVPRGQIEAAEAIGLTTWQKLRFVVLPQTFRVTLPALGNEFAVIIKDTSLLALVGAAELVFWGRNFAQLVLGEFEWTLTLWIVIAIMYFVVTYIITQVVGAIEHIYRVPGLGTVAF